MGGSDFYAIFFIFKPKMPHIYPCYFIFVKIDKISQNYSVFNDFLPFLPSFSSQKI